MDDPNLFFQRRGESITEWKKRLDAIDPKTLQESERLKLEMARRGIPLQRQKEK